MRNYKNDPENKKDLTYMTKMLELLSRHGNGFIGWLDLRVGVRVMVSSRTSRAVEFCCRIIACSWTTSGHPARRFCNFLTHFFAHSRHQFEHNFFRIPSSFYNSKYLSRATRSSTTSAVPFKHHVPLGIHSSYWNIQHPFFAFSRITLHFQEQFAVSSWVLSRLSRSAAIWYTNQIIFASTW
jgi:hypothetical protein